MFPEVCFILHIYISSIFIFLYYFNVAENAYVLCEIEGDPRLSPFTLIENTNITKTFCALRNAPVTFFRNRYIKIEVVNGGSAYDNIISEWQWFCVNINIYGNKNKTFLYKYSSLSRCWKNPILMTMFAHSLNSISNHLYINLHVV